MESNTYVMLNFVSLSVKYINIYSNIQLSKSVIVKKSENMQLTFLQQRVLVQQVAMPSSVAPPAQATSQGLIQQQVHQQLHQHQHQQQMLNAQVRPV